MTGRLKLLAAALGLVLATGTIADASAKTVITKVHHARIVKHAAPKLAVTGHRAHVARIGHTHKVRIVRHVGGHRVVKTIVGKTAIKQAGSPLQRHAMNRHVVTKAATVVR